jgi:hypothetical protein
VIQEVGIGQDSGKKRSKDEIHGIVLKQEPQEKRPRSRSKRENSSVIQ